MEYKCKKCEKVFNNKAVLLNHYKFKHNPIEIFECECGSKIRTKNAFLMHKKFCDGKGSKNTKKKNKIHNKKPEIMPTNKKEKCFYCGGKALFYVGVKRKPCCCDNYRKCPEIRKNNSNGLKKAHKSKDVWHNINGPNSWNKGKTKETDERIKIASEKHKQGIKEGKIIPGFLGKKHSKETKENWKKNPNVGGLREGSGRGIKGWYKEFYCRSTWELAWLVFQIENNVNVKKCSEYFNYIFENKEHKYYPDFMIDDNYYEIKGYRNKNVEAKIQQFPTNKKLILIEGKKQIKEYLDYCKNKYGKEFWKILYKK